MTQLITWVATDGRRVLQQSVEYTDAGVVVADEVRTIRMVKAARKPPGPPAWLVERRRLCSECDHATCPMKNRTCSSSRYKEDPTEECMMHPPKWIAQE